MKKTYFLMALFGLVAAAPSLAAFNIEFFASFGFTPRYDVRAYETIPCRGRGGLIETHCLDDYNPSPFQEAYGFDYARYRTILDSCAVYEVTRVIGYQATCINESVWPLMRNHWEVELYLRSHPGERGRYGRSWDDYRHRYPEWERGQRWHREYGRRDERREPGFDRPRGQDRDPGRRRGRQPQRGRGGHRQQSELIEPVTPFNAENAPAEAS